MATSAQLEREAEATRARIAATLDELRGRMTPGQLVDEIVDYARDSGGGEFFANFGRQVVGNPIPVTMVGAGLAWLMMAGRGTAPERDSVARRAADDVATRMAEAADEGIPATRDRASVNAAGLSGRAAGQAHDWAQPTRATAGWLNEGAAEAGASLQETAGAAGAAVRDTTSAAYDAAAERSRRGADAVARGARAASDNLAATGQGVLTMLREQPLVLAGLGLAIGGLLGASLPMTDTEDQLMGGASDAAKSEAKALATEQVEKGKAVAAEAWSAAKPSLDAQLHRQAGEERGGASGDRGQTASDQGATLVPSDQSGEGETARREADHPTE